MKHLSEEHLILHYYGETDANEHLNQCEACRAALRRLRETLDAFNFYQAPERLAGYETLVWQKLAPELRQLQTPRVAWWRRPLILGPVLAGMLAGSFFAGRISMHPKPTPSLAFINDEGRQRILQVALGDHLERSQIVLMELANARPADKADIHLSQQRAQSLVSENRLYRQAAVLAGDSQFSELLDEVGRVLTDIANGPSDLSSTELAQIQRRIESRELIFKVRVVGTNIQQKGSKQL